MVGKFWSSKTPAATADRKIVVRQLALLTVCAGLISGCTVQQGAGQQGTGLLDGLSLGQKKSQESQTKAVAAKSSGHSHARGHTHDASHSHAGEIDHTTTASVHGHSHAKKDGQTEPEFAMAPDFKPEIHDHPEEPWTDDIVTGSVAPLGTSGGKGRTKVERISNTVSASCRRILAEAGIETTMLRSPTLNGTLNNDEDISLGASYDLLDLRRADLKEELAAVQCARDDAAAKLAQLLVTSNHSHSQAGYRAKAEHLKDNRSEIASIKRAIDRGLQQGDITLFRATALRQLVRQLESEAARAEGEANKRHIVRHIQGQSFKDLDSRLAEAEKRIQQIERKIRTADAFRFKTSVDYSRRGQGSRDVTISDDGDVTAKISVSVRLGALAPQRFELEDVAEQARSGALYEVHRGVLWRSREAARVNRTVVGSVQAQRAKLMSALSAARASARVSAGADPSEMLDSILKGRIEVVRLSAELAAVNATFVDSGYLDKKLTFRR